MRMLRVVVIAVIAGGMSFVGVRHQALAAPISHLASVSHAQGKVVTHSALDSGYYDIVALGYYCEQGGTACYDNCVTETTPDPAYCPGLDFGAVEAVGNVPGSPSGTPAELAAQCGRTTASGVTEAWYDIYNYGPQSEAPGYPANGTLNGTAGLLTPGVDETAPVSESTMHASGWASDFSKSATVYGVQNTDNSSHSQNSGGFNITMRGPLDQVTNNSQHYIGTISCLAGGASARALQAELGCTSGDYDNEPFAYEGAMEYNAGDEYHNYSDMGPFDPSNGTVTFVNYLTDPGALATLCGYTGIITNPIG